MIVIVDYGVGNLFSLQSSFSFIGEKVIVSSEKNIIENAEKLILPGVGAFSDAVSKLRETGLDKLLIQKAKAGTPLMGICLGMQMLFEKSYEYGEHRGLSLIDGTVRPIEEKLTTELKIPHIGWNALMINQPKHPIFRHIENGDCVYFVHSYCGVDCAQNTIATTEYGTRLTAAVAKDNVCGCQFHPEKSGKVGLAILKGFSEWEGKI